MANEKKKTVGRPRTKKVVEKKVALTEEQLKVMDTVLPGFSGMTPDQAEKMSERLIPGLTDLTNLMHGGGGYNSDNYVAAAAYSAIYSKISHLRADVIKEVDKIRTFYLVDMILQQMVEDALAPDNSTGEILYVYSENETIQREVERLDKRFDFDSLVKDVVEDTIAYGEYILRTKVRNKNADKGKKKGSIEDVYSGVLSLVDDVRQEDVIPITRLGKTEGYLVQEDGKLSLKEPADYIKFSMSSRKIRVDLHTEFGHISAEKKQVLEKIPRYIRLGRSWVYSSIPKIKELDLLEQLVPASKLAKLSSGTIVGVQVPTGMEVQKALEAARRVENVINKKIGVDTNKGEVTLASILNAAGRTKVVPLFGDKGTLQKMDYQSDEPDELLSSVEDIRRVVTSTIGVPYEILFTSEEANKGDTLRRYARYLRRLKAIQRAMSEGIKMLVFIHLANKQIDFNKEDLNVEFRNTLIEIDNLDRLEFMDTTIGMLNNVREFIFELADKDSSPFAEAVDLKEFQHVMQEILETVGLGSVITDPYEDKEAPEPDKSALDGEPGEAGTDDDVSDGDDDKDDEPPKKKPEPPKPEPKGDEE